MANYKKLFWALAALPLLTACSSDEPKNGGTDANERDGGVYMSIRLNPTGGNGSRSQTSGPNQSSDGTEVGTDAENAVKTALIVLAGSDNSLISYGIVDPGNNQGTLTSANISSSFVYQATAQFSKTELDTYYSSDKFSATVNVFVYCNPSQNLLDKFDAADTGATDWVDWAADVTRNTNELWNATNGFIMTNAAPAERQLPPTFDEWNNYSTAVKPFDLSGNNAPGTEGAVDNLTNRGTIPVHRMAARLDFRDGSQVKEDGAIIGNGVEGVPFTYGVVKNVNGEVIVNCEILAMALNNMEKNQYYLGRVSDNGQPTGANYQLCGPERAWIKNASGTLTGGNYVISPDWKAKYADIKSKFSDYFIYPFFDANGVVSEKGAGWDWIYCSEVVKGPSDNYGSKSYHVWRYLTENAIPGSARHQINSQSTGVAFKARLLPTEKLTDDGSDKWEAMLYEALTYANSSVGTNKLLHNNPETDPTIYSLSGNSLYVTWDNVREAALAEAGFDATKGQNQNLDRTAPLYRICYGDGGVGTVTDDANKVIYTDDLAQDQKSANYLWQQWDNAKTNGSSAAALETAKLAFKKVATGLGFTLYQSSQDPQTNKWGYYCYYYYWVRHNDNLENGAMGPMEFAIVRNNVYKLTITSIHTLGHPRIPENDPEDPKPDDPDEKSEVYISVSVDVLPWVVRINNFDF